MPIVLARIDNRLVHGQVLEAWVPRLRVQDIVVVDGEVAADPFQCSILEGLAPRGSATVHACSPEAALRLLEGDLRERRTLVLFAGVPQAVTALRGGLRFETLNLGNLHPREGSKELTPSVYLTPEDLGGLREVLDSGVLLEARAVPNDLSPDVAARVRCAQTGGGKR